MSSNTTTEPITQKNRQHNGEGPLLRYPQKEELETQPESEADHAARSFFNEDSQTSPPVDRLRSSSMQGQESQASHMTPFNPPQIQLKPEETGEEDEVYMKSEKTDFLSMAPGDSGVGSGEEEDTNIQPKSDDGRSYVSPSLESQLNGSKGSGQALPEEVAGEMGNKIGSDFSRVNIHTDSQAIQMNRDLGARAFTHGQDIYFDKDEYNPHSKEGKHLLAHELIHTVQQNGHLNPVIQQKKRVKWKYAYKNKKGGYSTYFNQAKDFGLKPKGIGKPGRYSFEYDVYDKSEMDLRKKSAQKTLGKNWSIKVVRDSRLKSYRLRINPVCPKGFKKISGTKYSICFQKESDALSMVDKYSKIGIIAKIKATPKKVRIFGYNHKVGGQVFTVSYRQMTSAQAKRKGISANKKRKGYATGMYQVKVVFDKKLNTHKFKTVTKAPAGYKYLGKYKITGYVTASERDFATKPTVTNPPGLKGKFRKKFLYETSRHPRGVIFQGSGKSLSGKIIQYNKSKRKFYVAKCPKTASGVCAKVGRTIAVDRSRIKFGSKVLIEDLGLRTAEDTGGWIRGRHIDVYYGFIGMAAARRKSMSNKKVFVKK